MTCGKPRRLDDFEPGLLKRALVSCAAALLLAAGTVAMAVELYRWTDAEGKVHYGDRPAKGALNVTRVEIDPPITTVPPPATSAPAPKAPSNIEQDKAQPVDLATQRRKTREALEANLNRARARLEVARQALAEGADMQEDELQVVQQGAEKVVPSKTARMNCRQVTGKDGKPATICPAAVPNEKYYERIAKLEEAVRRAEEEVAAAEAAYRRGVD
jgi:hypothetical protein